MDSCLGTCPPTGPENHPDPKLRASPLCSLLLAGTLRCSPSRLDSLGLSAVGPAGVAVMGQLVRDQPRAVAHVGSGDKLGTRTPGPLPGLSKCSPHTPAMPLKHPSPSWEGYKGQTLFLLCLLPGLYCQGHGKKGLLVFCLPHHTPPSATQGLCTCRMAAPTLGAPAQRGRQSLRGSLTVGWCGKAFTPWSQDWTGGHSH